MKRVLSLMMALMLLLGAMAAAEERRRVAISCPYGSTDWIAAVNRCAEATAEALGMNYMLKLAASEEEQIEDLEIFENVAYIMAWHADPTIPGTIEEWLDEFEMFSIYQVLPEILDLWGANLVTDIESKKNGIPAPGR